MGYTSYSDFLGGMRGKKAAVLGLGVSNTPLVRILLEAGAEVTVCDRKDRAALGELGDELLRLGAELITGPDYLGHLDHDVIFRSPGIRPDLPPIAAAVASGSVLTSEMEVFFSVCPCPIIAVTGSEGKTTTTTLISQMLSRSGVTCHLGGNIGRPLLADTPKIRPSDRAVVELSSFQLMTMRESAGVAVVTNVTPNHLDIHKSMDEYIDAKRNAFRYQGKDGKLVANYDNPVTRGFLREAPGSVRPFSRREALADGVYLRDGVIWSAAGGEARRVMAARDIFLRGLYNVENYMAAIAAAEGLASGDAMLDTARTFRGVEHRSEFVRKVNGVSFYNDSIATSPTRTIASIQSFGQKVILIAGGYDKHIPFDALGPAVVEYAKALVLVGTTSEKIRAAVEASDGYDPEKLPILPCTTLEQAVIAAYSLAVPGDIVTLCPASAAFDMFENFAERGRAYRQIVSARENTSKRRDSVLDIQTILFELGAVPGVSGFERPIAERAAECLRRFCADVQITPLHNVLGLRPCGRLDAPRLLLDAHLDQIGFVVSCIEEGGFVRFATCGGFDPRVLLGKEVVLLAAEPIPGVIACMPPHLQTREEAEKAVPTADMVIDTGFSDASLRARVRVGTPITLKNVPFTLAGGFFGAAGLDDRVSFAAILYALELLEDKPLPVDLVVLGSSQEERSAFGAVTGAFAARPDYAIAVDVGHASTPDSPKHLAVPAGSGATISIGPHLNRKVSRDLIRVAKENGIPYTVEVDEGHTGTNITPIQPLRFGIATGLLGIPLRYMHTPVEVVQTADAEAVGKLLAAYILSMEGGEAQ